MGLPHIYGKSCWSEGVRQMFLAPLKIEDYTATDVGRLARESALVAQDGTITATR